MHPYMVYFIYFIIDILLSSLLFFLSHLAKLLSSHDASKGARAPKAWKSAVLTKSYWKKHRNPGCLEIPWTGDTLKKPWMNKQNMIEHVESGFRVWSFQKDTPPFPSTWRYWKDNPTIQWCRTWCLSICSRTGRWVVSTATPQAPHPGAKSMACQRTKTTTKTARDLQGLLHNNLFIPRSVPSLVFPTSISDQIWGHGDIERDIATLRRLHCLATIGATKALVLHIDLAWTTRLRFKKTVLQSLCQAGKQNSISINNFYNEKNPTRSWNTCFWLTGFPNDWANMGKLLGCSWKNFSLDALRHIESLGHLSLCPI